MKIRKIAGTVFILLVLSIIIYIATSAIKDEPFLDKGRCGVGLPSCSGENVRCINGYCRSDVPPSMPPYSDLPLTPSTKY